MRERVSTDEDGQRARAELRATRAGAARRARGAVAARRRGSVGGGGAGRRGGSADHDRAADRGDLVFGLNERSAILRQFAPEQFHDVAPGRDRITRAKAHAGRDRPRPRSDV